MKYLSQILLISFLFINRIGYAQYSGTGPVTITAPSSATNIQWYQYMSSGPSVISGQTGTTYITNTPGVYYARYDKSGSASCTNIQTVFTVIINQGETLILNGTTNNNGANSYQWKNNGVNIPGQTSADLNVTAGGLYSLEIVKGSCTVVTENYYVFVLSCLAGSSAPTLSSTTITNTCPATTVNLNSLVTSTAPSGARLRWHTVATNPTVADSVATPSVLATAGTYYAYYFDATQGCYSPASAAVTVTITACCTTPSVGGTAAYTGGTVCSTANIGTITLTGQVGAVVKWQTSTNGGTSWTDIAGTALKNSYNFINAANNQQYRAIVNTGGGCVDAPSSVVTITTSSTVCTTTVCSYVTGNFSPTITVNSNPTNTTQLILVNPTDGQINYVTSANTTAFTGVAVGDYILYAVVYDNTALPIPTLTVGTNISTLTGSCFMVSDPLITKVCTCPVITVQTTVTQPTCSVTTGTITVTAPTTGVTYSFDNGATYQPSNTKSGLAAGATYQVIVKENTYGCTSAVTPTVINAVLTVPSAPTATVTQPTCSVATGTITVTAPASGVTYSFDNGTNYQASATSSALASGTYQVLVKDNTSGCASTATAAVINAALTLPSAPTTTVTQPTCSVTTGTITVTAPTTGVTYSFNNGTTYQASATSSALASGTYQVLVKDNTNGCASTATAAVINAALTVPSAPTTTVTQPTCSVATGTITVTAPASGVTYSFNNGTNYQASATSSALATGTYQVLVKDNTSGCASTATAAVINAQPVLSTPTLSGTILSNTCPVTTVNLNSLVTSTAPSGSSLEWHTVATNPTAANLVATPSVLATAGMYYAYYFDGTNSCYSPASAAVTVTTTACCTTPSVGGTTSTTATMPVCSVTNTGTITVSGHTGSILKWQTSSNSGTSWTDIANTTTTLSFTDAPNGQQYRAVVNSGGVCSDANSTATVITTSAAACSTSCDVPKPNIISH